MHKTLAVEVGQSLYHRGKHFLGFCRVERALRKNLRQVLFRVLHHHVKQRGVIQAATPRIKHLEKIGMRKVCRLPPDGEAGFRLRRNLQDQLDGGLLGARPVALGEEHNAVPGTA